MYHSWFEAYKAKPLENVKFYPYRSGKSLRTEIIKHWIAIIDPAKFSNEFLDIQKYTHGPTIDDYLESINKLMDVKAT